MAKGKNKQNSINDKIQWKRGGKRNQREMVEKDSDDQVYAQVVKMQGSCRLTAFCFDGKNRLCHIRGKLQLETWINVGDLILVGLRGFQDDKADVLFKYTLEEANFLKKSGKIPEATKLNEENEVAVEFLDFGDRLRISGDDNVPAQNRKYSLSESDDEESTDEEEEVDKKAKKPQKGKK